MQDYPRVSVGLPVYNSEDTILASLNALRDQSYSNLEIIVGDNASTDRTETICRRFADQESRCRYFRLDSNEGAPNNFNFVFRQATGELFLWAAADDVLDLKFIEHGVRFLDANSRVDLAVPLTRVWLPSCDLPIYSCVTEGLGRDTRGFSRIVNSYRRLPMHSIYGMFRTAAIDRTQMLNSGLGSDVAFMQEVALRGPVETNRLQIANYHARVLWNTRADDMRVFAGDDFKELSQYRFAEWPGIRLLRDRLARIWRLDQTCLYRCVTVAIVVALEIRRILFALLNRVLYRVLGARRFRSWILWTYWRFNHSSDICVHETSEYTERVIMARFKWRGSQ